MARQTDSMNKCIEHFQLHVLNNPLFSHKIFFLRQWEMAICVRFSSSFMLVGRKKGRKRQKGLESPVLQKQYISWL